MLHYKSSTKLGKTIRGVYALQGVIFWTNNLQQNRQSCLKELCSAAIYPFAAEKGYVSNVNRGIQRIKTYFMVKVTCKETFSQNFLLSLFFIHYTHTHIYISLAEMFFCLFCWFQKLPCFSVRIIQCPRSANYELLKLWAEEQRDEPPGRNLVQTALKQLQTKGQAVHLIT